MNHFLSGAKRNWKYIAAGAGAAAICCGVLYIVSGNASYFTTKVAQDACRGQYPLTSRTIDCVTLDTNTQRIHSLDDTLDQTAALYVQEGKATRVSIFVRDLVSQEWAASQENELYDPASLMKLPLMIAYYKISELDPSIFNVQIKYTQTASATNYDTDQDFPPANQLVPGTTYTVEQLIEHMMIDSDNNATNLLISEIDPAILNQTFIDLGIEIPTASSTLDYVSVKSYAAIMRTLYNAAYLNHNDSEKALELMSKSAFKGIAEPLPSSVVVAHKFGEREEDAQNGTAVIRQLHDCGIVYKQPHPYVLCIMTEGSDFTTLQTILQNISSTVYQNM